MNKDQTIPSTAWAINSRSHIALPAVLLIGTGGALTNDLMRFEAKFSLGENGDHLVSPLLPNELSGAIEAIKSTLKLTVAEIAKCLNVSRQAIYDWKAGASIPKEANATKFNSLRAAAATIAGAGLNLSPLALRRHLPGGKTLLESISSGANGTATANSLLEMLRAEEQRRAALSARFEGRRASPTSMEAAAGPLDHE